MELQIIAALILLYPILAYLFRTFYNRKKYDIGSLPVPVRSLLNIAPFVLPKRVGLSRLVLIGSGAMNETCTNKSRACSISSGSTISGLLSATRRRYS